MFNDLKVAADRLAERAGGEEPVRSLRDLQRPALGQIEQPLPVPFGVMARQRPP